MMVFEKCEEMKYFTFTSTSNVIEAWKCIGRKTFSRFDVALLSFLFVNIEIILRENYIEYVTYYV